MYNMKCVCVCVYEYMCVYNSCAVLFMQVDITANTRDLKTGMC